VPYFSWWVDGQGNEMVGQNGAKPAWCCGLTAQTGLDNRERELAAALWLRKKHDINPCIPLCVILLAMEVGVGVWWCQACLSEA
jgi:hypothetical protein